MNSTMSSPQTHSLSQAEALMRIAISQNGRGSFGSGKRLITNGGTMNREEISLLRREGDQSPRLFRVGQGGISGIHCRRLRSVSRAQTG